MLGSLRRSTADAVIQDRRPALDAAPPLDVLERLANEAWRDYRRELGAQASGLEAALERLDRAQWTERQEVMDRDDLPDHVRGEMLHHMDVFNRVLFSYPSHYRFLRPSLEAARAAGADPVRFLDLASGRGAFPMYVARRAQREGLRLTVTGSDYHEAHVEHANETARERGIPASFRVVNGFDMAALETGSQDVIACEQALHHFTPGQLARMIHESVRVATHGFVGIDGARSSGLVVGLPLMAALVSRSASFTHDAWVSARRFFHVEELRLIARIACPEAAIETERHLPGFNVIRVRPRR